MHTRIVSRRDGFTWLEIMITAGALVLLFAVTGTGVASSRNRSQRLVCMDNLRQIGQGLELWAFDHSDSMPWLLYRSEGGTRIKNGLKPTSVAQEFAIASNELRSPKILLCPNDTRTRMAENWGNSPNGGYLSFGYRENATSYTINLHAMVSLPKAVMSSDRYLEVDSFPGECDLGFNAVAVIQNSPGTRLAWTNSFHGKAGNVLLREGHVEEMSSVGLRQAWFREGTSSAHMLIP